MHQCLTWMSIEFGSQSILKICSKVLVQYGLVWHCEQQGAIIQLTARQVLLIVGVDFQITSINEKPTPRKL
jgi:hypothetical protein